MGLFPHVDASSWELLSNNNTYEVDPGKQLYMYKRKRVRNHRGAPSRNVVVLESMTAGKLRLVWDSGYVGGRLRWRAE